MDMQNVSNLVIPEGEVRTIHDKNSRLLWGKLSYDTKYAGDTLQNGTPTPDTPIPVKVVTGEQTVTIGDGVDSEVFPISLGTAELCKLGNYQDYIYKSGDDWYVHKGVGKAILNGASGWSIAQTGTANYYYRYRYLADFVYDGTNTNWIANNGTPAQVGSATTAEGIFLVNSGEIRIRYGAEVSLDAWKAQLASSPMIFYYQLSTPTDTKITDSILISQLDAIHQFLTRYGYSATVSGNLPLIISKTNL